jgi:hypothetical protein
VSGPGRCVLGTPSRFVGWGHGDAVGRSADWTGVGDGWLALTMERSRLVLDWRCLGSLCRCYTALFDLPWSECDPLMVVPVRSACWLLRSVMTRSMRSCGVVVARFAIA